MKYFIIENGECFKYLSINLKDIKMFNKKYSLFIKILYNKMKNDKIYYFLKSKNIIDRIKGINLCKNYIKMVVIN